MMDLVVLDYFYKNLQKTLLRVKSDDGQIKDPY